MRNYYSLSPLIGSPLWRTLQIEGLDAVLAKVEIPDPVRQLADRSGMTVMTASQ